MKKNIPSLVLFILILFLSCSKEEINNPDGEGQPLVFTSLIAGNDTIQSGETTKITATASGYKLTFYWSATIGDILGSGNEITYAASPCQAGSNQITCTVKDGNNNEKTKEVNIVVL